MKKLFAIASVVALLASVAPAMACCELPDDGSIDTYFSGSGWNTWFNDALSLSDWGNPDYVVEDIWTIKGEVTVLQSVDIEDHYFGSTEVAINKLITVDPKWFFDANVEKAVVWDGGGAEIFRTATLGDVYSVVSAGADQGTFWDDIEYMGTVKVYESIGLNMDATCQDPEMPDFPDFPECTWCIRS